MSRPIIAYESLDLKKALSAIGLSPDQISSVIAKGHEQDGDAIAWLDLDRDISQLIGHVIKLKRNGTAHKYKRNSGSELDISAKVPPDNFVHATMARPVVTYESAKLRALLKALHVSEANIKKLMPPDKQKDGDKFTVVELDKNISSGGDIVVTRNSSELYTLSDDGEDIPIDGKVPPRNGSEFRLLAHFESR